MVQPESNIQALPRADASAGKVVTAGHLGFIWLPSKDKEGRGRALAGSSRQTQSPAIAPAVTSKNVAVVPQSSSFQSHLGDRSQGVAGIWGRRSLVTVYARESLSTGAAGPTLVLTPYQRKAS